jgi:CBS domain-containing protein
MGANMVVADVMTRKVAVVSPNDTVREAACRMDDLNVGSLPVCEGMRLVGIVTDRDITVRCTAAGASPGTRVSEAMTDDVRYCLEDDPVEEAELQMARVQIRRLPVVDRSKCVVGMVSLGDLATERVPYAWETLRSISEPSEPDRSFDRFAGRAVRHTGRQDPDYWFE